MSAASWSNRGDRDPPASVGGAPGKASRAAAADGIDREIHDIEDRIGFALQIFMDGCAA